MNIYGKLSKGTEYLTGTSLDDVIYPLGGSDLIDGKKGFDVVVVDWPSTAFNISTIDGITYLDSVSGASGADRATLRNVESVQFSDRTVSLEVPDVFQNTPGSDNFNGGPGLDTVVYAGKRADYTVQAKDAGLSVSRSDLSEGADWLQDIERLSFSDLSVAYDSTGAAGLTLRVLGAVFGLDAVHNPVYAGIGLKLLAQPGFTEAQLFSTALQIRLGEQINSPRAVVDVLYANVVGQAPSAEQAQPFVDMLVTGGYTPVRLAQMAAGLDLNLAHVGLTGAAFQGLEYLPQA